MISHTIPLLMALVMAVFPCAPSRAQDAQMPKSQDAAAQELVQRFFDAFDSRDYSAMENILALNATLVHDNGVMTNVPEMMEIIRTTAEWPPRSRTLSGFNVRWIGDVAIVGVTNKVTFEPHNRQPTTSVYTETWVLQRTDSGLHAVRIHYSLVTAEKHSEDVK